MKINLFKGIAVSLFIIIGIQSRNQPLNILPLGNSITQSNSYNKSYRYSLWTKLIDDGLDFNFVGSMTHHYQCGTLFFPTYQGQTFDPDHEGHWGWRTDQILDGTGLSSNCRGSGSLAGWLTGYTPDIVLLHLGTNDMYQGNTIPSTINEIKQVILTLRSDNPNIIILLAQLTPTSSPVFNPLITQLNAEIPSIAIDLADPDSPILIVDQNTGFNPVTDTWDGVHPNEIGEEKMAEKWRTAIMESQTDIYLDAHVYLEGPFNGTTMNTNLTSEIPVMQPFDTTPWLYDGQDSVVALPPDIVDWILVELRDAADVSQAGASSTVARKACFINAEGRLVNLDGTPEIRFNITPVYNLFLVLWHRNHLSVISASPLTYVSGVYSYNFTLNAGQAYGNNAQTLLSNGLYGMIAGDSNADGEVNDLDKTNTWQFQTGSSGYLSSDKNMDGLSGNRDKNEFWLPNYGKVSYLPE